MQGDAADAVGAGTEAAGDVPREPLSSKRRRHPNPRRCRINL
jgi:hypothetical protein